MYRWPFYWIDAVIVQMLYPKHREFRDRSVRLGSCERFETAVAQGNQGEGDHVRSGCTRIPPALNNSCLKIGYCKHAIGLKWDRDHVARVRLAVKPRTVEHVVVPVWQLIAPLSAMIECGDNACSDCLKPSGLIRTGKVPGTMTRRAGSNQAIVAIDMEPREHRKQSMEDIPRCYFLDRAVYP